MTTAYIRQKFYIGVDVGTTAIKAAAYDQAGEAVGASSTENQRIHSQPGWSSQSMEEVWERVVTVLRSLSEQIDPTRIAAIGVCAQGDGLWLLDQDRKPVRNAMLWNDQRASEYIEDWNKTGVADAVARFAQTALWPGVSGVLYRWLLDHEPESAANARYAVHCKDWVNFKLTGRLATDFTDATIPFLNLETDRYAPDVWRALGVDDIKDKLITPRRSAERLGGVAHEVAEITGLPVDTPVAVGALDVASMAHGMGMEVDGDAFVILGTTAVAGVVASSSIASDYVQGATVSHVDPGKRLRVLAPLSGASALDWFVENGGFFDPALSHLDRIKRVAEAARTSPPGSGGVIFHPFLNGERAPFVAPHATAGFTGITSSTTFADLSRAVLEGVAFSLRHCFASTGFEMPRTVHLTGGGSKVPGWYEIVGDVLNADVVLDDAGDHGLLGAAKLAAECVSETGSENLHARSSRESSYQPNPKNSNEYDNRFYAYLSDVAGYLSV